MDRSIKRKRYKLISSRYKELKDKYTDRGRVIKELSKELTVSRTTIWRALKD